MDEELLEVKIVNDESQELIAPIDRPNMCKWCIIYSVIMAALLGVGIILWYYGTGHL